MFGISKITLSMSDKSASTKLTIRWKSCLSNCLYSSFPSGNQPKANPTPTTCGLIILTIHQDNCRAAPDDSPP